MPERDEYIPGVPNWVDTGHPDPDAAVEFYGPLFGWEFRNEMPPESGGKYFVARIRGKPVAAVGSLPEAMPQQAAWGSYVSVESTDETTAKVRDAGGSVMMEPFDVMQFGRMAGFTDPEGAMFFIWQANQHKGAELVNEHGTVNFNDLNTRDPESAKSFYSQVFGWETLDLPGGFQMFTLPGYGDHLEESNPQLRADQAAFSAPKGFEDVVASIVPIGDDQPDTPPHWNVTFAVDDADAIADSATELGGKVIVPPMDAPWVRMTVIADPQGATFTASKFVPENRDLAAQSDTTAGAS